MSQTHHGEHLPLMRLEFRLKNRCQNIGVRYTYSFTLGSSPLSLDKFMFLYTCTTEVKSHACPYFTPVFGMILTCNARFFFTRP